MKGDSEGNRGPAPAPARSHDDGAGLFVRMLTAFANEWEAAYQGETYHPTPKDRSQLGRLLSSLRGKPELVEGLPGMFRVYVRTPDRFAAEQQRHSLAWFCADGWVNKCRTTARTAGYSEREIRGLQAAAEFVGDEGGGDHA